MKTASRLQRDVLDEFEWEPSVASEHIGVTVDDGIVTLTGHVPVYSEKHTAEVVAKRVRGVKAVVNEIEVRPTERHVCDDEELAAAAVHSLEWNARIPPRRIQVTVDSGLITLDGSVDEVYQRAAADDAVRHLVGIRGVVNNIVVRPQESIIETKDSIEAALRRNAIVDSERVSVESDSQHVVTLCGDVNSHAELDEAERVAWSARGVRDVINCITITPWGSGPSDEWGY